MARTDPHSYHDDRQPRVTALRWTAQVDFERCVLDAEATLRFSRPASGPVDLDTRELSISSVVNESGDPVSFQLHPPAPVLGARLALTLERPTHEVRIRYKTAPTASALQWLAPAQTAGGEHPFLFSQCQAIHARSLVPLQDTPAVRITYRAELTVPRPLVAVMAAAATGRRPSGDVETFSFEMPQAIPPYLFALAVGALASEPLSPRSTVWAEAQQLEAAAHEFSTVESMIEAAEKLFGPYPWERFDLLTMPPSFPYGGMENPRLTFLTPTLIAGDRSLVNVVAHELAHSWTGNLVTNANAEHFWLNEGFTVFAERRILEALEGPEMAALHAAIGRRSLEEAVARFHKTPELTKLRPQLEGIDPDDAFSQVPYEKGYLFLRALEDAAGRAAFDAFLAKYLERFRFQSITTDDFLALGRELMPQAFEKVDVAAWLDAPGIPAHAPKPRSKRLDAVREVKGLPGAAQASQWSAAEWQLYLELLPRPLPLAQCRALDEAFALTQRGNFEVLVSWLAVAVTSGHAPAIAKTEEVLGRVGRMKYLRPLYQALAKNEGTRAGARACFEKNRAGYHPIARQMVESVLKDSGA